jgi:hypothetical protein
MLHVSAIQGHLQATLMRGVLLHSALPKYLHFIMSSLFSSYIIFVARLFLYFIGVLLLVRFKCAFAFTIYSGACA